MTVPKSKQRVMDIRDALVDTRNANLLEIESLSKITVNKFTHNQHEAHFTRVAHRVPIWSTDAAVTSVHVAELIGFVNGLKVAVDLLNKTLGDDK